MSVPRDYEERVYSAWLGKCIGVYMGSPVEGWGRRGIAERLGEVRGYIKNVFKVDDDIAVPLIYLAALERVSSPESFSPAVAADAWLNFIPEGHGAIWWGGYGRSSEHTAYLNLLHGIPASASGSASLNGRTLAEQIGGQIFSDIFGLVCPGNPERAAELAAAASSISHDGEGVNGGRFIAAAASLALVERDPVAVVEGALRVLPEDSEYRRAVEEVLWFFRGNPRDWRAAMDFVEERFGYGRYPGEVPIIPNAAVVVLALLYSGGDFAEAVRIAVMCGWDTDCNAGNVGAIMGAMVGSAGIPGELRCPVNDIVLGGCLLGAWNLLDIPNVALRTAKVGLRFTGTDVGGEALPRCHFRLPGSTHGLQGRDGSGQVVRLSWVPEHGGALRTAVRRLRPGPGVDIYLRTYFHPEELSSTYYAAGFSPLIWPGQSVAARLFLPEGKGVHVSLYVVDGHTGTRHEGRLVRLVPGEITEVRFTIPPLRAALLVEVGLTLRLLGGGPWDGYIDLLDLGWEGKPRFSTDFSREREEYGAVSGWTYLRGHWRLEGGGLAGSGYGENEVYTGDPSWGDYSVRVVLIPVWGDKHRVNVRVQGALRSYAAGLAPGRLVLYKKDRVYREVASTPLEWGLGGKYELLIRAKGPELSVTANGQTRLHWRDEDSPYLQGAIGLSNSRGCHTRYLELAFEGI